MVRKAKLGLILNKIAKKEYSYDGSEKANHQYGTTKGMNKDQVQYLCNQYLTTKNLHS